LLLKRQEAVVMASLLQQATMKAYTTSAPGSYKTEVRDTLLSMAMAHQPRVISAAGVH
jgi:hypothetical protein